jgi:predicted dehydrogenase
MQVGIIGAGGIAGLHRNSWEKLDGAKIVAVADPSPESRAKAEKEWGARAYETVDAMLAAEKLDAVSICSPPKFHEEAALKCLEAGIPVFCEKPLARNSVEAQRIADAAKKSGLPFGVAFCHRFQPGVAAVKEAIEAGKLGKVLMVRNRFGGFQDMRDRWFGDPDIAGGGALLDTSIHSIDIFRFLAGEVAWVDAVTTTFVDGYRVEDGGVMLFGTPEGAIGVIESNWSTPGSANVVEVYGSEGAAVIDYNTGETKILADGEWKPVQRDGDRFAAEVAAFAEAVKNGTTPPVTVDDGLAANKIVDAAYKSHKEGRRVNVS